MFLPENLRRLREARDRTLASLAQIGVSCMKARAGFFVLADFSKVHAGLLKIFINSFDPEHWYQKILSNLMH